MKPLTTEKLKNLGLNENKINKIINNKALVNFRDETLMNHLIEKINYFKQFGFQLTQIINMLVISPQIFVITTTNIDNKLNNLKIIGYKDNEINKLILNNPGIIIYSEESINIKINELIKLGYSKEKIIKMTLKTETIFDLEIENNIKKKLIDLEGLGFSHEKVLEMTYVHPDIFTYSIESIKEKINNLVNLGFSKEITLKLVCELPSILGLSTENIKNKIEYLKEIDAIDEIIRHPKALMISVKVIYARYMFFQKNDITFKTENQQKYWLFVAHEKFENAFNISKTTLINKYDYTKYCEEKLNGKTK